MVNVGRPSRDCLHCRRRKLKCDLKPETCGQCRRARIPCTGYRDPAELVYRDETDATKWKVLSRQSVPIATTIVYQDSFHSRPNHDHDLVPVTARTSIPTSTLPTPLFHLPLALDAQARHAFFAHYVLGLSRSHDTLATLYPSASPLSALSAAVDAASLAFLTFQFPRSHPSGPHLARQAYALALRRVAAALSAAPADDATLQAVLLLDLYEKLTATGRLADAWMSHVRGGLGLARTRGAAGNFGSYVGRRLALRLVVTLVISCAAAGCRVPREVTELQAGLEGFVGGGQKWKVTELVVEVVNLMVDVREGKVDAAEARKRARELDGRFVRREGAFRDAWTFVRVAVAEGEAEGLVYGGWYDVYHDHFYTQVRNVVRTMRLLLAKMRHPSWYRIEQCSDLSTSGLTCPEDDEEAAEVLRLTDAICLEIVASVPQFVWVRARPGNALPFTPLQTLRCYTLLAPLYLAVQLSPRDDVRSWAVGIMDYMADCGGIRTAKTVAQILREQADVTYWDVYAMLGSYAFSA